MPRVAVTSCDDLADALIRVVAGQGLDAVSIRAVAREAGVSIGTVQHYFATKDELLLAAYRRVIDQVTARARRAAEEDPSPRDYIRSLLRELLPLDDRREAELRVAVAFTARSVHSRRLTELYTDGYGALVDAIANALRRAVQRGEAAPDVRPRRDAIQAVALADGLGWHQLCAPGALASDAAEDALDAHLARLLPARRA
jgi:AcrR family transcriptional regulator